ncbi:ArsR/SmtB family transcription factor [Escherichia coli]|uniref:ArsR/SmtB family transcription factor n=1 Tax=Escherichia coli TaxID=562 RepID=UPI003D811775
MSVLLCLSGEANVTELEAAVGITQPTLSQQLGVMRRLKLVETRRAGKMVYYRIGDNRIMTLLNTLYDLYCPQSDPDKVKKQP